MNYSRKYKTIYSFFCRGRKNSAYDVININQEITPLIYFNSAAREKRRSSSRSSRPFFTLPRYIAKGSREKWKGSRCASRRRVSGYHSRRSGQIKVTPGLYAAGNRAGRHDEGEESREDHFQRPGLIDDAPTAHGRKSPRTAADRFAGSLSHRNAFESGSHPGLRKMRLYAVNYAINRAAIYELCREKLPPR